MSQHRSAPRGALAGLALQLDVQNGGQCLPDPVDLVLGDAPWVDEGADRVAVADVDAGVVVLAPHEHVAWLRGRNATSHRSVSAEPLVVAGDGAACAADSV